MYVKIPCGCAGQKGKCGCAPKKRLGALGTTQYFCKSPGGTCPPGFTDAGTYCTKTIVDTTPNASIYANCLNPPVSGPPNQPAPSFTMPGPGYTYDPTTGRGARYSAGASVSRNQNITWSDPTTGLTWIFNAGSAAPTQCPNACPPGNTGSLPTMLTCGSSCGANTQAAGLGIAVAAPVASAPAPVPITPGGGIAVPSATGGAVAPDSVAQPTQAVTAQTVTAQTVTPQTAQAAMITPAAGGGDSGATVTPVATPTDSISVAPSDNSWLMWVALGVGALVLLKR